MWSDLHFGDHTRTLSLSNARIRPSFLRDVAKKSDEVLSQESGDQFDHDRRDFTWMMVKRLGYLQMAEELTRVVVSFNSARFIYPHYIKMIPLYHIHMIYHLSPLYHGYQSLYPNDTTIFVAQIPFAMVKILGAKLACQGLKVMYHRQHRQLGLVFFFKKKWR